MENSTPLMGHEPTAPPSHAEFSNHCVFNIYIYIYMVFVLFLLRLMCVCYFEKDMEALKEIIREVNRSQQINITMLKHNKLNIICFQRNLVNVANLFWCACHVIGKEIWNHYSNGKHNYANGYILINWLLRGHLPSALLRYHLIYIKSPLFSVSDWQKRIFLCLIK